MKLLTKELNKLSPLYTNRSDQSQSDEEGLSETRGEGARTIIIRNITGGSDEKKGY